MAISNVKYSFDVDLIEKMKDAGYDVREVRNFTILDLPRSSYKQDRTYTPGKSEEDCPWTKQELIEGKRVSSHSMLNIALVSLVVAVGCISLLFNSKGLETQYQAALGLTKQTLSDCETKLSHGSELLSKAVTAVTTDMERVCQETVEIFGSNLNCSYGGQSINLTEVYPDTRQAAIDALKREITA